TGTGILDPFPAWCDRWFGSFRHDFFHAHRFSWAARLHGFDRVDDCPRGGFCPRFQKTPFACAWPGRVVLALRRCRLGVGVFDRFIGWISGVGAMWLWHARPLCNAAVSSQLVNAAQISSLLLLGAIFWRQVLAPREDERMSPPGAVLYLFSACVACSILGILI